MEKTIETYLNHLVEEKGYDTDALLEVEGPSGLNVIPLECVLEAIVAAPYVEQVAIRHELIKIDFLNGDCLGYLRHLAQAIAV